MNFDRYFGCAEWVGTGNDADMPLIRQSFSARAGERAEVTVLGFGVFILYINGVRVHESECLPLATDFEASDFPSGEILHHRAYVERFDISHLLTDGENVISALLGNGWYNRPIWEESFGDGRKKIVWRISLDGREVCSGAGTRWVPSDAIDNHYNKGEERDLRVDYRAAMLPAFAGEDRPVIIEEPLCECELGESDCPRDYVIRTLTPRLIHEGDGCRIYDFGINTTGYPIVRVHGERGEEIRIAFSEDILPTGDELDPTHEHDQKFNLISSGEEVTVRPYFGWIAARYAAVTGNAEIIAFDEVHADIKPTAEFECDGAVLNYLFDTYLHTQLTNMHTGLPSDCPQLERRGYTGDGQLVCHASMMMTDSREFYRKWLVDISDCQDRLSGHVQYTAPYTHAGGGPGGWGSAMVTVPYEFYLRFGEDGPIRVMYPQMKEYLRYLDEHTEFGLVTSDRAGEWCLGEWVTPDPVSLPAPFVNNYFYIKACEKMIKIARIIGREEDIPDLEERIGARGRAMTAAYFNPWDGNFLGGVQGANAFALDVGLGDGRTRPNMIERYRKLGHLDTGIFGTEILTRLLFEYGESELAVGLLSADTPYGFGRFMKEGRTTLPEYWGHPSRSLSHPMFGAAAGHLIDYVLGIRQTEDSTGYESIVISPVATEAVKYAKGSVLTARGDRIAVEYRVNEDGARNGTATDGKCGENKPTVTDECDTKDVKRGAVTVRAHIPAGVSARLSFGGKDYPLATGENVVEVE